MDTQPKEKPFWHSEVIVLAIVLSVAAVVMIAGFYVISEYLVIEDDHRCKVTVQMSSPPLVRDDTDEMPTWQATSNVLKITPRDTKLRCSKLQMAIISPERGVIVGDVDSQPDQPSEFDNDAVSVQLWYSDNNMNGRVDVGDVIRVTGLSEDHMGCYIRLKGDWDDYLEGIGDIFLPEEFP